MILMNKLRPQLEQHISLLDTRRLEALTENLEQSLGAQETGLVLLARRELSGRRTGGFTNIRRFWESDFLFNSREGIARRIEEIEDIRTVQIPLAAKAIAEAASHGDLSENAEYTAALEKRDFLLEMLNRYQKQLKLMRPYPVGQVSVDVVSPATRVIIESMGEDPEIRTVFVVGLMDADADKGYINYKAPLGAALLGLAKGDTVQLPGSTDSDWRITEISLMEEKI
jgi:transcription elongation factor GreA